MNYNLITILGPTAVGKTRLAARLADYFKGEIISADSRQVYRGMNIGTGKDLEDYIINGKQVPFHLIDIIEPSQEFNLFLYQQMFFDAFNRIISKGQKPFLVGGTGLFIHSILKEYELIPADFNNDRIQQLYLLNNEKLRNILLELNPELHNTTDLIEKERLIRAIIIAEAKKSMPHNMNKTQINSFVIGVQEEREIIKSNITARLKKRLDSGMIDEVKKLVDEGLSFEKLDFFGLEYKFIGQYLQGNLNYNDMFQKLNSSIHQFAKRQMTWFRKMEREGINIHWLNGPDFESAKQLILENIKEN